MIKKSQEEKMINQIKSDFLKNYQKRSKMYSNLYHNTGGKNKKSKEKLKDLKNSHN